MERTSIGQAGAPAQHRVHVIGIHSDRDGSGKTTLTAVLERIARYFIPVEARAESAA